jgi:hypothetical protein
VAAGSSTKSSIKFGPKRSTSAVFVVLAASVEQRKILVTQNQKLIKNMYDILFRNSGLPPVVATHTQRRLHPLA